MADLEPVVKEREASGGAMNRRQFFKSATAALAVASAKPPIIRLLLEPVDAGVPIAAVRAAGPYLTSQMINVMALRVLHQQLRFTRTAETMADIFTRGNLPTASRSVELLRAAAPRSDDSDRPDAEGSLASHGVLAAAIGAGAGRIHGF